MISVTSKTFFKLISITFISFVISACSPFGDQSIVEIKNPNINWMSTSFDYGDLNVGSNLSAPFVLQNTGAASVNGCGEIQLSDSTNFSIVSNTCTNSMMNVGEQCQVEIASHPTTPGTKNLNITRQCANSIVVQTAAAEITSNGIEPNLSFSLLTHDFGNITIATNSSAQAFTFANSGTAEATGCSPAFISDTTNFTITADTCGSAPLSVSSSCIISVQANPTTLGSKSATLVRSCTFGGVISTTANQITTNGTGTPNLAWSPLTKSFGNINTGATSSSQTFTLTNSGSGSATTCSAPTIGDTTNFTILSDSCATSDLAASGTCTISVRGNPTTVGLKSTTVSRICVDGGTVTTTANQITVTGTAPSLAWSPLTKAFGNVNLGKNSSSQTFTLTNSGTGPATTCSAPTISDTTNFTIASDTCSTSNLAASSTCSIDVRANPTTLGAKATTISRTCTFGGTVTTTSNQITTTGTSTILAWSPLTKSYGNVTIGFNSVPQTFTLTNSGTGIASGCSAPVISDSTNFTVVGDTCTTSNLNASSACAVDVVASPTTIGLKTATISRTCSDGGVVSTTSNQITTTGIVNADWQQEYGLSSLGLIRSGGGQSNNFNYYFRNPSGLTLSGCTTSVLSNTTDFTIVSDSCASGSMAPYATCEIKIKSNPVTVGSKTTNLTRTCNETGSPTVVAINSVGDSAAATPIQVATGEYHSCALFINGTVKCWGAGSYGQLGNRISTGNSLPVLVSGISTATQIDVSGSHSCALLSDSTVKCWGYGAWGQLGNGTTTSSNTPVVVSGISTATQIDTGQHHTCALLSDSTIKCWGRGESGQLGNSSSVHSSVPVVVSGISNATEVGLGHYHSCAVLSDLTLKCWGNNWDGALGDGTRIDRSTPVVATGVTNVVQVVGSEYFTCALLGDGNVKCWGYDVGQFGNGTLGGSLTAIATGFSNTAQISAGYNFLCVQLNDGTMKCSGGNERGQIGDDTQTTRTSPTTVANISSTTQMATGHYHTCALKNDGTIQCWGFNNAGQLGDGTLPQRNIAYVVPAISTAVKTANSQDNTCVLLSDGTVKCWGATGWYSVLGSNPPTSNPVLISGLNNVTDIAAGQSYFCALINDATVKCWGTSIYGGVGTGGNGATTPTTIPGLTNVTSFALSDNSGCAILTDQTVKCWGNNWNGQLGDGTTITSNPGAVAVIGLNGAVSMGLVGSFSCAIMTGGSVKCWGGVYGYTPQTVPGITNAIQLTGNEATACALLSTGAIKCWGSDYLGLLGNSGLTGTTYTPVYVDDIQSATQVVSYRSHTCALLNTGAVKCWGANYFSSLGDVTVTARTAPVFSLNLNSILKIGISGGSSYHTCHVKTNNTVVCLGNNASGQAGFNENFKRTVSGL